MWLAVVGKSLNRLDGAALEETRYEINADMVVVPGRGHGAEQPYPHHRDPQQWVAPADARVPQVAQQDLRARESNHGR